MIRKRINVSIFCQLQSVTCFDGRNLNVRVIQEWNEKCSLWVQKNRLTRNPRQRILWRIRSDNKLEVPNHLALVRARMFPRCPYVTDRYKKKNDHKHLSTFRLLCSNCPRTRSLLLLLLLLFKIRNKRETTPGPACCLSKSKSKALSIIYIVVGPGCLLRPVACLELEDSESSIVYWRQNVNNLLFYKNQLFFYTLLLS